MYDVLIIGAGAAGLTAAMYSARKKLKTIVVTVEVGGQTNFTASIENFPGIEKAPGIQLTQTLLKQATGFGAELASGKVAKVEKTGSGFSIQAKDGQKFDSKAVILAFGKVPRTLGIPGEDKFFGKGISSCVTCDGPLFKGKEVVLVGGGNSAIEGALELGGIAKKVYLVHRRDKFTADPVTLEKLKKFNNIEYLLDSVPVEVKGGKFVSSVVIENVKTNEKRELAAQGVFLEIGFMMDSSFVKDLVKLNEKGEVVTTGKSCETSVPGVFAAGDCTDVPFKQTSIAAGEGAKAALQAHRFVTGAKGISIDWEHYS